MSSLRPLGRVAAAAAAFLAVVAPVAAAQPDNGTRSAPFGVFSSDAAQLGLRVVATDETLTPVDGVAMPSDDPNADASDPPFVVPSGAVQPASNCGERDTSQSLPFGWRSIWYQITPSGQPAANGAWQAFGDNTIVTLDASGSTFNSAMAVYAGGVPAVFDRNNPVLATNLVACQRGSTNAPPFLSFIARAGVAYFLQISSTQGPTFPLSAFLTLNIRVLDAQAPTVGLAVDPSGGGLLPNPDATTTFIVRGDDHGSGIDPQTGYAWAVAYRGAAVAFANTTCLPSQPPPAGQACLSSDHRLLRVHWPAGTSGTARVALVVTDRVGNATPLGYVLTVADRTPIPPTLWRPRSVQLGVRFTASCKRNATLKISVRGGTTVNKHWQVAHARANRRYSFTLRHPQRGVYLEKVSCATAYASGNASLAIGLS